MRGPGSEAQANAIIRRATSSVDAEPIPTRRCGGDGTTTGAGQLVKVRVRGTRQGNVCGPDEVNLVTMARGEPLVGTPTGGR